MMVRPTRRASYRTGVWAEIKAAIYLICCGYRILKWRYKTPVGEIDLIARRGRILAFVEVKARRTQEGGLDAVSMTSWQRIARAAERFDQAERPQTGKTLYWRYDLMVVRPWRLPYHQRDTYRP
jgi:putative endonuclease